MKLIIFLIKSNIYNNYSIISKVNRDINNDIINQVYSNHFNKDKCILDLKYINTESTLLNQFQWYLRNYVNMNIYIDKILTYTILPKASIDIEIYIFNIIQKILNYNSNIINSYKLKKIENYKEYSIFKEINYILIKTIDIFSNINKLEGINKLLDELNSDKVNSLDYYHTILKYSKNIYNSIEIMIFNKIGIVNFS